MEIHTLVQDSGIRKPAGVILPMIQKGEYDLVNISLIGHDPVTGRSFEECKKEWDTAYAYLLWRIANTKWWQVWLHIANRYQLFNLALRSGMLG